MSCCTTGQQDDGRGAHPGRSYVSVTVAIGSRMRLIPVAALCACGRVGFDPAPVPGEPWLDGYHHRKRITVTQPGTTTLGDFPVGVIEVSDADLAAAASADALVFTTPDAVVLAYEIASFDPVTGALEAWVADTLPPGTTTLDLYYDGPAIIAEDSPWALLAGVWHMTVTPDGVIDATGHGHTATAALATTSPAGVSGIAGFAARYDGVDDSLSVPDPADGSLDFPLASFTFELWVDVDSTVGPSDIPLHKGGSSTSFPGYDFELGAGAWIANLSDGVGIFSSTFGADVDLEHRWVHIAEVVDRVAGTAAAYVDGAGIEVVDIHGLGSIDSGLPLSIGRPVNVFAGGIDEVRIYPTALSADWIAAEHANLALPGFVTIDPEETR
jgi:hypothetical protein